MNVLLPTSGQMDTHHLSLRSSPCLALPCLACHEEEGTDRDSAKALKIRLSETHTQKCTRDKRTTYQP